MEKIPPDNKPGSRRTRNRQFSRRFSIRALAVLVVLCAGCTNTNETHVWESARYHGMMLLAVTLTDHEPGSDIDLDTHRSPTETTSTKKSPKHVFYFTANWCGPCQRWRQHQLPALEAQGWNSDWITLIDIDERPDLKRQYHVNAVPTFVVLRGEHEIARSTGFITANNLARWVNAL